ncbi:nuclear transport factor 2 family protein [Actinokineospora soli]
MVHDAKPVPWSTAATAAGVDHVRLSYLYLDEDDPDAFASLLHADVRIDRPDCRGGRHALDKVIADGDCVAVVGRYSCRSGGQDMPFADVFTLSAEGLLLGCRRYYAP